MSDGRSHRSLNEPAKHVSAASLTFILTMSFLGITAVGITDRQLLIGHRVRLPLLDVEVPVFIFSVVAPVMVVLFHLVFLLQAFLLAREARRLRADRSAEESSGATDSVSLPTIFVQVFNPDGLRIGSGKSGYGYTALWLVARFLVAVILVILPVALLAVIQWRFVPYHSWKLTLLHQLAMTADLVCCLTLVPLILTRETAWSAWWKRGWALGDRPRYFTRAVFVLFLVLALFFSWVLAIVPHTLHEGLWGRRLAIADLLHRDLRLSGVTLGSVEGFDCPPALPIADLSDRDLRGADLSRAQLVGVDLRGADLREARMVDIVLRCADLSPVGIGELIHLRGEARRSEAFRLDPPSTGRTQLRGADLSGADMRGARLELADLRSADLSNADLRGVEAIRVDLRGATLRDANLTAADLSYARLDGAVLDHSTAACATFYAVSGRGLQAVDLRANGSDLRRIDLRSASLPEADLTGVDLDGGLLQGADLRATRLQAAVGLDLRAVDLRWADLRGARARPVGAEESLEVDAREAVTGALPAEYRAMALSVLADGNRAVVDFESARDRWRSCLKRGEPVTRSAGGVAWQLPSSSASIPVADALQRPEVLRDSVEGDFDAPGAITTEAQLHLRLMRSIGEGICNDFAQAALVVLRSLGCVSPRDPVLEARLRELLSALSEERSEECKAVVAALVNVEGGPLSPGNLVQNEPAITDVWWRDNGLPQQLTCDQIRGSLREQLLAQP